MGFCSAIWDTNNSTSADTVIDSSIHEGKA
jgi:hypothetical protein